MRRHCFSKGIKLNCGAAEHQNKVKAKKGQIAKMTRRGLEGSQDFLHDQWHIVGLLQGSQPCHRRLWHVVLLALG